VAGRAKAAAEKYNVPAWYTSYEKLLNDKNVDMITLGTPIGMHYDQAVMALSAGKHIHCNKTVTTTVAECDELMRLAGEKGLHLVPSPGMMMMPHNQRMRRAVLEGRIGDVSIAIAGGAGAQHYHIDEPYRHGDDVLSNTNMYDIAVYFLHIMTGILGPVKRVSAFASRKAEEYEFRGEKIQNETDDHITLSLDFGNHVRGLCYCATAGGLNLAAGPFTPIIVGSDGNLFGAKLGDKSLIYDGDHQPNVTPAHQTMPEKHVFADIMQVVDLIRGADSTIVTMDHARHVIDIIESGYASEATGKVITLTPTAFKPLPLEALANID
jgi:predicted dehydrogenase